MKEFLKGTWQWWLLGGLNGAVACFFLHGFAVVLFIVAVPILFVPLHFYLKRS